MGAAMLGIVGFGWGGWVTGAKADISASELAKEAVIEALVPICVSNAATDPNSVTKVSELKSASSYKRTEIVNDSGWATMTGSDEPSSGLAKACAIALLE